MRNRHQPHGTLASTIASANRLGVSHWISVAETLVIASAAGAAAIPFDPPVNHDPSTDGCPLGSIVSLRQTCLDVVHDPTQILHAEHNIFVNKSLVIYYTPSDMLVKNKDTSLYSRGRGYRKDRTQAKYVLKWNKNIVADG